MSQTLNLYSFYDVKGEFYGSPFVSRNHNTAIRMFSQAIRTQGFACAEAPCDFHLVHIGSFSDEDAQLISVTPKTVITGVELLSLLRADEQGAAVGDSVPLKSQSDQPVSSADAVSESMPACDVGDTSVESTKE